MNSILSYLRRLTSSSLTASLTDGQLLESFIRDRDEAAFEGLVRAHGPMVWGVCQRVLQAPQQAEDAFQATFMVLVQKAGSIWPREQVGHWLHGVAYRTALKAKTLAARRQAKERQAGVMNLNNGNPQRELLPPLVDEELQRLPSKYRVPMVLCDLEGKSQEDVARQLGLPASTIRSRVARARDLLRDRLARRGCILTAAALAAGLSPQAAQASLPVGLLHATIQSALAGIVGTAAPAELARAVLQGMLIARIQAAAGILLALTVVGIGTGLARRSEPVPLPAGPVAEPMVAGEVAAALPPEAPKPPRVLQEGANLAGTLTAFDLELGVITVRRDTNPMVHLELIPETAVTIDGKPGRATELRPGLHLTIKPDTEQRFVLSVSATGPTLTAPLSAIDAAANRITLALGGGEVKRVDRALPLADQAQVLIDGKPASLSDLKAGNRVVVQLSTDQQSVLKITFTTPRGGEQR